MKNKRKQIAAVCIVLALAVVIGRIVSVNASAFSMETEIYQVGDWVPLSGSFFYSAQEHTDGYSIQVESAEALRYETFMERFDRAPDYLAENSRQDVILLKLNVKNENNTDGGIFIRDFWLSNEYRSAYFCRDDIYMAIANPQHEQVPDGVRVRPGTEASFYIVYTTIGRADGVTYLEEISGREDVKMSLDVSLYPVRKNVKMRIELSDIR